MSLLEKVEAKNDRFRKEITTLVRNMEKRLDDGVNEMRNSDRESQRRYIANYVLSALAIIAGLVGAILSGLIASGVIRTWE